MLKLKRLQLSLIAFLAVPALAASPQQQTFKYRWISSGNMKINHFIRNFCGRKLGRKPGYTSPSAPWRKNAISARNNMLHALANNNWQYDFVYKVGSDELRQYITQHKAAMQKSLEPLHHLGSIAEINGPGVAIVVKPNAGNTPVETYYCAPVSFKHGGQFAMFLALGSVKAPYNVWHLRTFSYRSIGLSYHWKTYQSAEREMNEGGPALQKWVSQAYGGKITTWMRDSQQARNKILRRISHAQYSKQVMREVASPQFKHLMQRHPQQMQKIFSFFKSFGQLRGIHSPGKGHLAGLPQSRGELQATYYFRANFSHSHKVNVKMALISPYPYQQWKLLKIDMNTSG